MMATNSVKRKVKIFANSSTMNIETANFFSKRRSERFAERKANRFA